MGEPAPLPPQPNNVAEIYSKDKKKKMRFTIVRRPEKESTSGNQLKESTVFQTASNRYRIWTSALPLKENEPAIAYDLTNRCDVMMVVELCL